MKPNYTRISFEMSYEDAALLEWFDGEAPVKTVTDKILNRAFDIKRSIVEGKLARIAQTKNLPFDVLVQEALEEKVKNLQAEHNLTDDQIKPTQIGAGGIVKSNPNGIDIPDFSSLMHTPSELIPKS